MRTLLLVFTIVLCFGRVAEAGPIDYPKLALDHLAKSGKKVKDKTSVEVKKEGAYYIVSFDLGSSDTHVVGLDYSWRVVLTESGTVFDTIEGDGAKNIQKE